MKRSKSVILIAAVLAIVMFTGISFVFAETDNMQALWADFNFYINGQSVELSEQAVVINSKTYLPARALGQAMGKRVGWDEDTKTVIIDDSLPDGTYNAVQPEFDEHGWKGMVTLEVRDGKIDSVKYDETNAEGIYKSTDEAYLQQYKEVTQVDLLQRYEELQTALVNAQHIDMVDTVSGATHASQNFKSLVKEALLTGPVPTQSVN